MTQQKKQNSEKNKLTKEWNEIAHKIIEQAKLLSTGKIRNVYELEMAARELTKVEEKIALIESLEK